MKRTIPALLLLAACTGGMTNPPQPPAQEAPSLPRRGPPGLILLGCRDHHQPVPGAREFPLLLDLHPQGWRRKTVSAGG